ncbi:MAG: zinc ABC transporter substrate-binding protein [Planctomycetes bacterium]|nr:zinc ABC transporter substrate-binding protein [Planctomycetota bacterium]
MDRKGILRVALAALALSGSAPLPAAPIKVVATTLDMAHFAQKIGGDRVDVDALFTGKVDIHFFEPRPRQVLSLRRADLLIVGGLAIDVWATALSDAARNPKIRYGAEGYIDPADGVRPLQIPQGKIDGASGHVHPYGNPHYWLTRENVEIALRNIERGLARVSPGDAETFRRNREAYVEEVRKTFAALHERLDPFKGARFIQYHQSWDYFAREFGLVIAGDIEPKPGIPPSAAHLAQLIAKAKADEVALIVAEPYYPRSPIERVAEATGARVVRPCLYLGGRPDVKDFLENLRRNVEEIAAALEAGGGAGS